MRRISSKTPYESDYIKKILNEQYRGQVTNKPVVVKLSCHPDINVELKHTGDQIIVCPRCFKRNVITWSPRSGGTKITYEQ